MITVARTSRSSVKSVKITRSAGAREKHRRHHVVFGDPFLQIIHRGILRAQLFGYTHRGKVEEENQQTLIVKLDMAWSRRRDGRLGIVRQLKLIVEGKRRRRLCIHRQALIFEDRDLLRLSVLKYREIVLLQTFDGFAGLVSYRYIDDHQIAVSAECRRRLLLPK